jgi:hypothetical protein
MALCVCWGRGRHSCYTIRSTLASLFSVVESDATYEKSLEPGTCWASGCGIFRVFLLGYTSGLSDWTIDPRARGERLEPRAKERKRKHKELAYGSTYMSCSTGKGGSYGHNSKGVGRMRVVLESQIEATTSCTVVIHLTVAAATAGLRYIGRGAQWLYLLYFGSSIR